MSVIAFLVVLILACARVSAAQVADLLDSDTGHVTIDAESLAYDEPSRTVTALGGVVIQSGESELRAERVEVNRTTGEARAVGDVLFSSPDADLTASEMHINLEDETGTLVDGWVRSERHGYSLRGDRIEKGLGQTYRIEGGKFTTCNCDGGAPSWSLSARKVDIELDGYAWLDGGTFNILDWPILYLPKAIIPVTRERHSGLLLPHFGFSNRRGFQVVQPVYIAIDRSRDATLGLDVESNARVGLLAEYRYASSRESAGQVNASYFKEVFRSEDDREDTDGTIGEERWSVVGAHNQSLPLGVTLYASPFLVSDDLFLREINVSRLEGERDVSTRTLRYTRSALTAVRTWERGAVRVEGDYYQSLTKLDIPEQPGLSAAKRDELERERADELTFQRVPEVAFWGQGLLGSHVHAGLDATATTFQREEGIDGFRVDVRPALTLPIRTGLPLEAAVRVGFRETAYALTENEMRGGLDPDSTASFVLELPSSVSREIVEIGGEVSTELSRIYDLQRQGLQRLKHTVEPVLAYDFVPDVGQEDLPIFDDADRVNQRNLITFGFRSRLLGRYGETATDGEPQSEVRELAQVSILQSYDVDRQIGPVGEPPGGPASDHFSDIDLLLRTDPFRSTSVLVRSSYDTSDGDMSAAAVSLRLTDPRESDDESSSLLLNRTAASLGYRFITQSILQQLDASILLRLTRRFGVLYATRYDVQSDEILENHFGIRMISSCDCWALDVGFTDKTNPSETELRAQLTLVGFGSSLSIGEGLGKRPDW